MINLTKRQIERQDFVDNKIFELTQKILPRSKQVEWDIEMIGTIRDIVRRQIVDNRKLMSETSIDVVGLDNKDKKHSEYLSYLGNQNNPPDFIIKKGDAVEVKKIGGLVGSIALNSSYPKSKLHSDDVRILQSCRECDGGNWSKKDIISNLITI